MTLPAVSLGFGIEEFSRKFPHLFRQVQERWEQIPPRKNQPPTSFYELLDCFELVLHLFISSLPVALGGLGRRRHGIQ